MSPKVFAILFVCLVVVAVEATYPEGSRDETERPNERCDENFCGNDIDKCHKCCHENFHFDYKAAGDDSEKQHDAIDKLCACYHKVNGHNHH